MHASLQYYPLEFKRPAGTSRGELHIKHSWILTIDKDSSKGIGEISIIPGLSPEFISLATYSEQLNQLVHLFNQQQLTTSDLNKNSAFKFGLESALLDLQNGGTQKYFDNSFYSGGKSIPINGLIWMGTKEYMLEQVKQKLNLGFTTLKMKIGAINIDDELTILKNIRKRFDSSQITLRVDANGAFTSKTAIDVLQELSLLEVHSIEQPIEKGNWQELAKLCHSTPTPIALDEELIGVHESKSKLELLQTINPQYIILKPSLHGGISGTQEWISIAENLGIQWWMTSALESNIGLNVICQLAASYNNDLPQGLGTGSLYVNNIPSGLAVKAGHIYMKKGKQ
jgi:O-succinylbenzoate synthase